MKKFFISIAFVLFIIVSNNIIAQDVISVNDLEKIMKDKNVVIVHAGKEADYKLVHITGSVHLLHEDLFNGTPLKNKLKPTAEVATILGSKGISNTSKIIVYDEGSGKYSGRLYWALKYLGAADVKMLNGNLIAWKDGRKPVTKNPSTVNKATFTVSVNKNIIVTTTEVKAAMNNSKTVLVDVRDEKEFLGQDEDAKIKKGHIPGSVNIEYKKMVNEKSVFKSKEELQKIFTAKGITSDKEVILICSSGTRSGIVYLVLTSYLGYTKVKVYDGAFQEYQSDANNKVVTN